MNQKASVPRVTPTIFFRFRLLLFFGVTIIPFGNGYMVGNNPYRRLEKLDPRGKYWLEWEVDWSTSKITFNVTVETRGYVGFGLSNKGKMSGADIVIGGVFANGQSYFSDRHAVANQIPEVDPSQDWDLHEARENSTHTFLSFSRLFDTCDPQDYSITDEKISLIWAYGEKDDDLEYHYNNRGEFPVYLLSRDYSPPIQRDPKTNFPIGFRNLYNEEVKVWSWHLPMIMPVDKTTYWCTMHKGPSLSKKHHMIGFEMRFNDETIRKHVHHIIISKCHAPRGFNARSMFDPYLGQGQTCYGAGGRSQSVQIFTGPIPLEYCSDYLQGTAAGERIHFFPPHVGNPFGENPNQYYAIQVHYDNPEMIPGLRIDLHLDVYYTPQLRQNEGGVFVVRHESPGLTPSHLIPPFSAAHKNHAICGSECTSKILPKEGIRIHSVLLHAHNNGVGIRFRHFRGNHELPFIAEDSNFAFNFQQMRSLQKEVHVLPGDQLLVECVTDNTRTNGTILGGFATTQEMCAVWFYYFKRLQNNMICASEIDSPEFREHFFGIQNVSWSDQHIEYLAKSPRKFAGLPVSQVSDMIHWTLSKREELQRFQLTHPQMNRCPVELYARAHTRNENGEPMDLKPEENQGRLTPIPRPAIPYIPPRTICSA